MHQFSSKEDAFQIAPKKRYKNNQNHKWKRKLSSTEVTCMRFANYNNNFRSKCLRLYRIIWYTLYEMSCKFCRVFCYFKFFFYLLDKSRILELKLLINQLKENTNMKNCNTCNIFSHHPIVSTTNLKSLPLQSLLMIALHRK